MTHSISILHNSFSWIDKFDWKNRAVIYFFLGARLYSPRAGGPFRVKDCFTQYARKRDLLGRFSTTVQENWYVCRYNIMARVCFHSLLNITFLAAIWKLEEAITIIRFFNENSNKAWILAIVWLFINLDNGAREMFVGEWWR